MLGQAIALGLVSALGRLDGRILGISMFDRPIVTATLAGLILGDPVKGVMIGAALELIYIGAIAIGAASPPRYCYRKYISYFICNNFWSKYRSSFSIISSNSNVWINSWNCNKDN